MFEIEDTTKRVFLFQTTNRGELLRWVETIERVRHEWSISGKANQPTSSALTINGDTDTQSVPSSDVQSSFVFNKLHIAGWLKKKSHNKYQGLQV
jgi:hypothetical protein